MYELVVNLHMHTHYSDGHTSHAEIIQAAFRAGLDVVIVTDHNVWVQGPEDAYKNGDKKVMLLVGEELHDRTREPQKNHLLVFGADRELAGYAHDPQTLINTVNKADAIAYLAHPVDPEAPAVGEPDISWEDWNVYGYVGIELWNGMSEFKSRLQSYLHALYYAFNPKRVARGPFPATMRKWDELLKDGHRVSAIGGSDAHAFPVRLGPIRRTLFPYEFHFKTINTHLYVPNPISGDLVEDKRMVLDALRRGCAFIGYDLPARTNGFRFTAQGKDQTAFMGDEISAQFGVTFLIHLPMRAECSLIKDGKVIKTWRKRENCTYITSDPGAYRVEVYIQYLGRRRGWIFSNPIYVRL